MRYSFLFFIMIFALNLTHAQNEYYLMSADGHFLKKSGLFLTVDAKTFQEATKFKITAKIGKSGLDLKLGNEFVSTMDASAPSCLGCMLTGSKSNSSPNQITVELLPKNGDPYRSVALKNESLNRYLGGSNFNGPLLGGKNVRVDRALMSIFPAKTRVNRFIAIDARAVDIAIELGIEYSVENANFVMVNRVGYIQNTIEIPAEKIAQYLNQYVQESDFELYNKEGHSKMRLRLGPETIPYINQTNVPFYKGIPNVYLGDDVLKIMPYRLNEKHNGVQLQWNNAFELVIYFESSGAEFTVEQKIAGKWVDYTAPDLHWDHANVRIRMELEESLDNIRVKRLYCKSTYGKWGVRALNGIMTNSIDEKLNSSISKGLNDALADAKVKKRINEFLTESLEGELKKVAGTNLKLNAGYQNGKLIITFKIPTGL